MGSFNVSMRKRLWTGSITIVICLVVVAALGLVAIYSLKSVLLKTVEANTKIAVDSGGLRNTFNTMRRDTLTMILESDDTKRQSMMKDISKQTGDAEELIAKLKGYFKDDPINSVKTEEIERTAKTFFDTRDHEVIAALEKGNIEAARKAELGIQKERFRQLVETCTKLKNDAAQKSEDTAKQAQADSDFAIVIFAIFSAVTLALVIYVLATIMTSLRATTSQISTAVSLLSAAASQILVSTSESAASASETATAVAETTTTVEEVRQTSEQASQRAKEVSETAENCAQISLVGLKATDATAERMKYTKEQVDMIADSMVQLTEKSQDIAGIIATVDELAQQSKLLAVNAALEAADAGEYGTRFKVVAQEVKGMAEQSKQATSQVRAILTDIQKATNTAAMNMEVGSKSVDSALEHSSRSGTSIQQLADSVSDSARAAAQIAMANRQQLAGVDQVVRAMQGIREAMTQNLAAIEQVKSAAETLDALGTELRTMVEQYKV